MPGKTLFQTIKRQLELREVKLASDTIDLKEMKITKLQMRQ